MQVFYLILVLSLTNGVWSCDPGCRCLTGKGRGKGQGCVQVKEICGDHAHIVSPAERQASCEDPQAQNCNVEHCKVGCKCDEHYILNGDAGNKCTTYDQCKRCGNDTNAKPQECGSACQPNCDEPEVHQCTEQCVHNKCVCNPGYMEYCKDGRCVRPEECPGGAPNCGANKTYTECINITVDSYCPGMADSSTIDTSRNGKSGCVCKPCYKILSCHDPTCVAEEDCPGCGGDMDKEESDCANAQPSCDNMNPDRSTCVCEKGCACKPGLVLLPNGKCGKPEQCPCCEHDDNATGSSCMPNCRPTCHKPCPDTSCTNPCKRGCVCKEGYVIDDTTGKCVNKNSCC